MTVHLPTELSDCFLRAWSVVDKAELICIADNRAIWRNLTDLFPHPYTAADADYWVEHASKASPSLHLAIEFQGRLAGGVGIIAGAGIHQRTGQFGYWLGEQFWGNGLATVAARALVQHACSRLPFARLEAVVFAWNPKSMRVLEKVGFLREGVMRRSVFKDGELIDSVMYSYLTGA
jgi:RimJ/RimL family protein N-acetyltransferase